jgi:hypothetical protein
MKQVYHHGGLSAIAVSLGSTENIPIKAFGDPSSCSLFAFDRLNDLLASAVCLLSESAS